MLKNGLSMHNYTKQNMLATPYVQDPCMEQLYHSHSRDLEKSNDGFILHQAITKATWPAEVYILFKGIPCTLFSNADLDNLLGMYS